jgi:hypothetical protein
MLRARIWSLFLPQWRRSRKRAFRCSPARVLQWLAPPLQDAPPRERRRWGRNKLQIRARHVKLS